MGKEVQKRWRSIRDSYTKAYRQGKCVPPEMCAPGSRRYNYHKQMAFLLTALKHKKPRYSQDKYESFSELSNSPSHPPPEDIQLKIKNECIDKPLDLKTKPDNPERPETMDKCTTTAEEKIELKNPSLEIKIDANSILPEDHFDDDKLFMNSLLPLFKKMDDDTRLLCRIEVLKIIRYALQGHKCFEALKMAEDSFFRNRISGILAKEEVSDSTINTSKSSESKLSMVTRSADGTRTIRKRKDRSLSPLPVPAKKRGPGRPRKIRPPQSDSESEQPRRRPPPRLSELDDSLSTATSVAQLSAPMFMKMYNLGRSKAAQSPPQAMQISIKTEPIDPEPQPS
ncbi:bromodomain-containing protein 4-like isoform X2 [Plodia interpunctella]|uniref:bromodomain-containing protein 4-like isoform X2 n=1 Tax=Plodia interpunctella TaxID=58824 RepID=UPI002368BA3A|nr:bromodomain-containing protein 4-like isoform X2 [Plodia interpunctella]